MRNPYSQSFKPKLKSLSGRPDLTPLVDVLFLLLIFFMLSSSFVQISNIKVELPQVSSRASLGIEKFIVSVAKTEKGTQIYFNDKVVSWETLKQELANVSNFSTSASIIIRADRRTPFGVVARVMSMAEKANLTAYIATMPPKAKQEAVFEQNER
jgi:biopolymer transport protein ExbD